MKFDDDGGIWGDETEEDISYDGDVSRLEVVILRSP